MVDRLFGAVKNRSDKIAAALCSEGSCLLVLQAVIRGLKFGRISL